MSKKTIFLIILFVSIVLPVFALSAGAESYIASAEKKNAEVVEFLVAEPVKGSKTKTTAPKTESVDKAVKEDKSSNKSADNGNGCSFADKLSLTAYINPFAYQNLIDADTKDNVNSNYGFGIGAKAAYDIKNGFYVAADFATQILFADNDYTLVNLPLMISGGYRCNLGEKFGLFAETGFGMKLSVYDGDDCKAHWLLGMELGADYQFCENWASTLALKGTWNWQETPVKGTNFDTSAWGLNVILGAKYKF